jgi:cobalt/nickel transport system permease protein
VAPGARHAAGLYLPGGSALHRLPPQAKVAAAVLFVIAVVATPSAVVWAFGVHAGVVMALALLAGIPLSTLVRRLTIEVPFLAFALLLPFVARGDRVDLGPLSVSGAGLLAAWGILAKGSIGVATAVVLTATTPVPALLAGLDRLHVPRPLTAVASFMVRYGELLTVEAERMRIARLSRGHDPRWFWQARAVAASAGTLFVRSYERGERVYLAMLSRGWAGSLPTGSADRDGSVGQWAAALALPAVGLAVAGTAVFGR